MRARRSPQLMKPDADRLAQRLETELGAGAVSRLAGPIEARSVDGTTPALVCSAANSEHIRATLRLCAEAAAAVTPWGGGTAMAVGNLPTRIDVALDVTKLNGVIEHDHANLTATVQAGITISALQTAVAPHGQFLAFDCSMPQRSTVGGVLAVNLNGPRRACYGSVRDLVTGMKVALPGGERIRAGGKVVKNVAGYDMCKLFIGSLGSLGIITEATVRLTPIAQSDITICAAGSLARILELAAAIRRSALLPAAMLVLSFQPGAGAELPIGGWQLVVRFEGFDEAVARQERDLAVLAERAGLHSQTLVRDLQNTLWNAICDFPLAAGALVYRAIVPCASAGEVIRYVETWQTALSEALIIGDLAAGVLWISTAPDQSAARRFTALAGLAAEHRGHAILFAAPADLKRGLDVWGRLPPAFPLMREIKRRFDPDHLLNPGRFVGHL